MKQLKYKNAIIPGFFIDFDGKIYDANGVEQKQKIYKCNPYYHFKGKAVHVLMAHSFYGYKEGFDIHHLNSIKSDNRLQNLVYLTHKQHSSLHNKGKKLSDETKEKIREVNKGKKLSEETKEKIREVKKKSPVFCPELNKVFESIMQASRELALSDGNICTCCQGKRKTCGGLHFEFYTGAQK